MAVAGMGSKRYARRTRDRRPRLPRRHDPSLSGRWLTAGGILSTKMIDHPETTTVAVGMDFAPRSGGGDAEEESSPIPEVQDEEHGEKEDTEAGEL